MKAKKKTNLLLILLIAILLVALLFCVYRIYTLETQKDTYASDLKKMSEVRPGILDDSGTAEESGTETLGDSDADMDDTDKGYLSDALAVNPDTVAWIYIPDTEIDFPVMQTDDNEYYLRHAFSGLYSVYGCPFLDMRNNADFTDFVSIIYGHNTVNDTVFAPLLEFADQEYLESHNKGLLILNDEIYRVNFFACSVTDSYSDLYTVAFTSKAGKQTYIEEIKNTAVSFTEIDEDELSDERLLLLSTCSEEYENARTILIGSLEQISTVEEAWTEANNETESSGDTESNQNDRDTESTGDTEIVDGNENTGNMESADESVDSAESEDTEESENSAGDSAEDETVTWPGENLPQISYTEPTGLGERFIVREESFSDGSYVTVYQYSQYLNIHTAVFKGGEQSKDKVLEILESYVGYELDGLELEKDDERSGEYGCIFWETSFIAEQNDGKYYYYGAYLQYGDWDVLFLAGVPEAALYICEDYARECADSLVIY